MSKRRSEAADHEQGQGRNRKESKLDRDDSPPEPKRGDGDGAGGPASTQFETRAAAAHASDTWAVLEAELLECNPDLTDLTKEKLASRNRIEVGEDGVTLAALDLSGLALVALPPSLAQVGVLQSLNLQGNRLESLPDWFASIEVELDLNLRNNMLTALSPRFCEGIRVGRNLHLGNNRLQSVPESFANIRVGGQLLMLGNPFPRMEEGVTVTISGVQSRPELNGQRAVCLEPYIAKDRWRIRLESSGEELSLKDHCLSASSFPKLFPNVGGIVFPPRLSPLGSLHWLGRQGPGSNIVVQPSAAHARGLAASIGCVFGV